MINVLDVEELLGGHIKLSVGWWNKGQSGTPFPIAHQSTIIVAPDQLGDWSEYAR